MSEQQIQLLGSIPELQQQVAQLRNAYETVVAQLNQRPAPAAAPPIPSFNLKPAKPETFDGRSRNPAQWCFQVDCYFRAVNVNEDSVKLAFAVSLLRGPASEWYRLREKRVEQGLEPAFDTWIALKTALVARFQTVNAAQVARDKLAQLRQVSSVRDYISSFNALVLQIPDLADVEKLDRFRRGLKPNIRKDVEIQGTLRELSFEETINLAERLDNVAGNFRSFSGRDFQGKPDLPPSTQNPSLSSSSGPAPMDLNAASFVKLTAEERERLMKLNLCFYCRKGSHRASNCPEKKREGKAKRH